MNVSRDRERGGGVRSKGHVSDCGHRNISTCGLYIKICLSSSSERESNAKRFRPSILQTEPLKTRRVMHADEGGRVTRRLLKII